MSRCFIVSWYFVGRRGEDRKEGEVGEKRRQREKKEEERESAREGGRERDREREGERARKGCEAMKINGRKIEAN